MFHNLLYKQQKRAAEAFSSLAFVEHLSPLVSIGAPNNPNYMPLFMPLHASLQKGVNKTKQRPRRSIMLKPAI